MKKHMIEFLDKQKQKVKKISLPIILLMMVSTQASYSEVIHTTKIKHAKYKTIIHKLASCSKLAKVAGIKQKKLETIIHKLVKIESRTGKYNVQNHRSGAYGRYQIMPSTAKHYAKKLNIPFHRWKEPHYQDEIFNAIMKDNIKSLKRHGHQISAFSIYATHQQGAHGFDIIMKNKTITKTIERNMRKNLPDAYNKIPKSLLRFVWINYWKNKLS